MNPVGDSRTDSVPSLNRLRRRSNSSLSLPRVATVVTPAACGAVRPRRDVRVHVDETGHHRLPPTSSTTGLAGALSVLSARRPQCVLRNQDGHAGLQGATLDVEHRSHCGSRGAAGPYEGIMARSRCSEPTVYSSVRQHSGAASRSPGGWSRIQNEPTAKSGAAPSSHTSDGEKPPVPRWRRAWRLVDRPRPLKVRSAMRRCARRPPEAEADARCPAVNRRGPAAPIPGRAIDARVEPAGSALPDSVSLVHDARSPST